MADNSKKRPSSFRKLFPSLFFSHKTKKKINENDSPQPKNSNDISSISNHYQNPRLIIRKEKSSQDENDNNRCIYANITIFPNAQQDTQTLSSTAPSNNSSSSTLVSDSVKCKTNYIDVSPTTASYSSPYTSHAARPQVPPKPNESHTPEKSNECENPQYPDVYYHSMEKLTNKISHFDEIKMYGVSGSQIHPTPVGAEIKKVSKQFLISPKKEAEVRTIQPTKARSLSFSKNKGDLKNTEIRHNSIKNELIITKPYNYSAPTSPIPFNHKIPNMPKTVSPYEHVRKTIMETETKRNSLSRSSVQKKSTPPSPRQEVARPASRNSIGVTVQESHQMSNTEREKTRQRVEVFYWQKLKEQKAKEDEYLLGQSLNYQMTNPTSHNTYSLSNCSTPSSFTVEPRSFSLPRGQNVSSYDATPPAYINQTFVREAPERRTDTFISKQSSYKDSEVTYRHPERNITSPGCPFARQTPIFQRASLTRDFQSVNQQIKRVSFEEQFLSKNVVQVNNQCKISADSKLTSRGLNQMNSYTECLPNISKVASGSNTLLKAPPRPPVRTSSVNKKFKVDNSLNIINAFGKRTGYSESESGSEASEIQRILRSTAVKGKQINIF